jgi:Ca-activated chloride channel family protein
MITDSRLHFPRIFLLCLLPVVAPRADQVPKPVTFQTNAEVVLVPFAVSDRNGRTVKGLDARNFTVLDDGEPQRIVSFATEDTPCSVAVVLDISGSMRTTLTTAMSVAHAFLRTADPLDEFALLTISTEPQVLSGFTSEVATLEKSLALSKPQGLTALIDTVYFGLSRMRKARWPHRAMLVLSDGMDNHSRYSERELKSLAGEADVQIYTILVSGASGSSASSSLLRPVLVNKPLDQAREREGPAMMEGLSNETGGIFFRVRDETEAKDAAIEAGQAIRSEYIIGYQPPQSHSTRTWHQIRVKSDVPRVKIYARKRYYAR